MTKENIPFFETMTSAQIENFITSVSQRDRENIMKDEHGVIFNEVRKKLLRAPADLMQYSIPYGTEIIVNGAFRDCKTLQTLVIPDTVVYIGQYAFEGCISLMEIKMPGFMHKIDVGCFMGCTALYRIILPEGIKVVHKGTFEGCSRIKEIVIKGNIKTIETKAFRNCSSLTSFIVPMSVKEIQEGAFSGCKKLQSVTFWNANIIIADIFSGCTSLKRIIINEGNGALLKKVLPQYQEIIVEDNIIERLYGDIEFSDDQIMKKLARRKGTIIKGVRIESVTITTMENYRRVNLHVDRCLENYYLNTHIGKYVKESRNTIYTSEYRVRQLLKNESDMEFLLAHFSRAPKDLVLLMNGAEIVLYGEMVEANKEYHSIWGCKLPICNHDYIVYEIVSLKPCKDGLKNIVEIKEQYLKEEDKRIIF